MRLPFQAEDVQDRSELQLRRAGVESLVELLARPLRDGSLAALELPESAARSPVQFCRARPGYASPYGLGATAASES